MIQITEQMERIFSENPLYSKDGQGMDAKVIARFYIPGTRIQWLVTEASKEDDKWILYGYAHIFEWEWGYTSLEELIGININGLTLSVEIFNPDFQIPMADMYK